MQCEVHNGGHDEINHCDKSGHSSHCSVGNQGQCNVPVLFALVGNLVLEQELSLSFCTFY